MFSTFLQEIRGYLGKGFLLAVFIPTLLFWSINVTIYLTVTMGLDQAWQQWSELSAEARVILLLAGLVGLSFFAYLIHNLQLPITRLFEGYWQGWPLLRWLQEPRRRYYLREWQYLAERVEKLEQSAVRQAAGSSSVELFQTELNEVRDRQLTFFPPPRYWIQIRPTQLGNILRASELYAVDHYGLDAVVVWTRLRPLLDGQTIGALQDKKMAMDFMLLMTLYAGLFAAIWCPILAIFTNEWQLFLLCATGLPVARICYQSALQSALAYGEEIRVVFDLHRYKLLTALGLKIPVDRETEQYLWEDISLFFHRNIPPTDVFQLAISPEASHKYLGAREK